MSKKLAGVELEETNLADLVASRKALYPGLDIVAEEENAKALIPSGITYIEEKDSTKEPLRKIAFGALLDQNVMLQGPKGTGKTTGILYLAQETKNPIIMVQLNGSTGVDSLLGKWLVKDGTTFWVDGLLTKARKYGYWIVLDELNMALPEVLAVLHPALDDRRVLVLDEKEGEVIKRHPNTRVFSAINPTEDYAGTKEMNAALMDRFNGMVLVDYPNLKKEISIVEKHKRVKIDDKPGLRTKTGIITRIVETATALRKLHKDNKLIFECSTRNLIDWASRCSKMPVKEAAEFALLSKADPEDRKQIMVEVSKMFIDGEQWGVANPKHNTKAEDVNTYEARDEEAGF